MQIQNHSQTSLLHLQRNLETGPLEAGPLGTIGNLQFKPEQGGTARASRPGMRTRLGHFLSELKFAVSLASREVRAQHRETNQIRVNSRQMGDLLGSLTVPFKGGKESARIAQHLTLISKSSQGNLANLPGGQALLSSYLSQLTRTDLFVLREGVLNNWFHRDDVLSKISPGLRTQAAGVLEQIREAVNRESVREPLLRMAVLLSVSPVDMGELYDTLFLIPKEASKLNDCFQSLPKDQSEALLIALRPENLDIVEQAVLRRPGNKPLHSLWKDRLSSLRELVRRETHARSPSAPSTESVVIYTQDLYKSMLLEESLRAEMARFKRMVVPLGDLSLSVLGEGDQRFTWAASEPLEDRVSPLKEAADGLVQQVGTEEEALRLLRQFGLYLEQ